MSVSPSAKRPHNSIDLIIDDLISETLKTDRLGLRRLGNFTKSAGLGFVDKAANLVFVGNEWVRLDPLNGLQNVCI